MSDSASSQAQDGTCAGGGRFRYLRWAAAVAAGTALAVAVAAALHPAGDLLYRENGVLENVSVLCWILSCIVAFWAALRSTGPGSRLMAAWTGWLAAVAALRELDLHMLLNPQRLGALGVRYRPAWWMDGSVSFWLKLGWATVFLTFSFLVVYPPLRLRRFLFRLFREGDALTGLLALSVVFLAFGFVVDEILPRVRFVSHVTRQLIEETSETIGAIFYCASMVLQWRRPLAMRLHEAGFTIEGAPWAARFAGAAGRRRESDGGCSSERTSHSGDERPR